MNSSVVHATAGVLRFGHGDTSRIKFVVAMRLDYAAHIDASGTTPGQTTVAVAGCVSPAGQWSMMVRPWTRVLERHEIPYFHMAEFMSRRGLFHRWTDDKYDALAESVARMTVNHTQFIFGGALNLSDYQDAVAEAGYEHPLGAEGFCVQRCIDVILKWLPTDLPSDERVKFVFDRDAKQREILRESLTYAFAEAAGQAHRLGEVSSDDKRIVIPLQVADICAHQTFQHTRDDAATTGRVRYLFRWVLERVPHDVGRFSREHMAALLRTARALAES